MKTLGSTFCVVVSMSCLFAGAATGARVAAPSIIGTWTGQFSGGGYLRFVILGRTGQGSHYNPGGVWGCSTKLTQLSATKTSAQFRETATSAAPDSCAYLPATIRFTLRPDGKLSLLYRNVPHPGSAVLSRG